MAPQIVNDATTWRMKEDDEGHREYDLEFLIRSDPEDGPFTVRNTPGLPLPGSPWIRGNDIDMAARCKRRCSIDPVQSKQEKTDLWKAGFVFSTKPDKRCQDFRFEDPLTEPQKLSGTWTKIKTEATKNRYDIPLRYSSHERMKGSLVEFDDGLPTVRVEQNVLNLELPLLGIMLHTVNSVEMWGLPIRCVKLSGVSWSEEYYGNCYRYYKRTLEFEINVNTFDRKIADVGSKALYGRWERPGVWRLMCIDGDMPDYKNPSHFVPFKFPDGTPGTVPLNGKGIPAGACVVWDECAGQTLRGKMLCPELGGPMLSELTTTGSYSRYFVSAWNNNIGNSLQDEDIWVNIVGSTTPSDWQSFIVYARGRLVTHANHTWLAWRDSRGQEPGKPTSDAFWLDLGLTTSTGTGADHALDDRGVYNPCTTYNMGDYVVESSMNSVITGSGTGIDYASCDKTQAGFITVEYYAETDLRLLGVPLVF